MALKDIKEKLYRPEKKIEERPTAPELFQPGKAGQRIESRDWQEIKKEKLTPKQKKWTIAAIAFGAIFLIFVGFLIWRGMTSFDKDEVKLEIRGPEQAVSGDEIIYTLVCENKTKLDLNNLRIIFYYPEDSIPLETDDLIQTMEMRNLAVGQRKEIKLPARIIGLKDEEKKARVELTYQPGEISSSFTNKAEFKTKIISVPLILDFDMPERLVNGQAFNLSLRYINEAEVSFDNIHIKIEYPNGYIYNSASPQPVEDEDNLWKIGNLMAGEEGKISIQGSIQGEESESKTFKAQLGILEGDRFIPYAEEVSSSQISVSPLFITQAVNGTAGESVVNPGEKLFFQINYKNTADVAIKDVVITSKLEGKALDLSSLELDKGYFNGQLITWNSGSIPELAFLGPNQSGQISFSVRIKDYLTVSSYSDKNFTITNSLTIDSSNIPLSLENIQIKGESKILVKVASQLSLQAKGYYYDDLISNSGPIPPRVGQTTTYTIRWQITNSSDDLTNVKVSAYLPPHVQWMNNIRPSNANLSYNSQSGQVVWSIGNLSAGVGMILPAEEVAFQVGITPSSAHIGNLMELIGQSAVSGHDSFVNSELTVRDKTIDTNLPDDPRIDWKQGVVNE